MVRVLNIAWKDIRVWGRDVAALGVLLGMPIVLIFILGSALGGAGEPKIPVAVENLDAGRTGPIPGAPPTSSQGMHVSLGDELVEQMQSSERLMEVFDVSWKPIGVENQRVEVAHGRVAAVLIIPEDFTERVQSGKPAELQLLTDPGAELSASIFKGVVGSFAAQYSATSVAVQTSLEAAKRYSPGLLLTQEGMGGLQQAAIQGVNDNPKAAIEIEDSVATGGAQTGALDYYAVSMTGMFLMFGAMFGAFSTIKERREQTLSRLLSTPTSGASVAAGKMVGIFLLGMLQFTVLFLATRFVFGVEWGRDVVAIFAVAAAEMLAVTGLAVLIGSLVKTERGAGGLGPLVIQVQALLGGAFFAITILPEWLQPIRYASVVGWALEGWKTIQAQGGGLVDVATPVAALTGFAVVFFGVSAVLTGVRR